MDTLVSPRNTSWARFPLFHTSTLQTQRGHVQTCATGREKENSQSQVWMSLMCVPRHFITKTKRHSWAGRNTFTLLCCSRLYRLFKPKQWYSAKKHVKSKPHKPCMCVYLHFSLGSYPVSYQSLPWWTPKLFLNQKTMALHQQSDHTTFILFNPFLNRVFVNQTKVDTMMEQHTWSPVFQCPPPPLGNLTF